MSGQLCVSVRSGVVSSAQVADALWETRMAVQLSLPLALTVLLTVQALLGAMKLAVKLLTAPGTNVSGPTTGVLATG